MLFFIVVVGYFYPNQSSCSSFPPLCPCHSLTDLLRHCRSRLLPPRFFFALPTSSSSIYPWRCRIGPRWCVRAFHGSNLVRQQSWWRMAKQTTERLVALFWFWNFFWIILVSTKLLFVVIFHNSLLNNTYICVPDQYSCACSSSVMNAFMMLRTKELILVGLACCSIRLRRAILLAAPEVPSIVLELNISSSCSKSFKGHWNYKHYYII